mmetsp:Transcript_139299/g.388747  ORF Transcript_139299/g.388747 Transcript_139299/m.388747 type:complete len:244 (+) Transcript_139299:1876-2607(+)
MLQHRHDAVVISREVLLDYAGDDCDGGDGLLADAAVLRRLQLGTEFLHEGLRVLRHQRVLQLFTEGNKSRHGHGSHTLHSIVHHLQECGHDRVVLGLLEVRRLVVRQLPEGVQRHKPDAWVRVLQVLQQDVGHGVHVGLVLHILYGLLDRGEGCMSCLPLLLRGEMSDGAGESVANAINLHDLHHAVNGLLARVEEVVLILVAFLIIHAHGPGLELLFPILHLKHEVHAGLEHERGKVTNVLH